MPTTTDTTTRPREARERAHMPGIDAPAAVAPAVPAAPRKRGRKPRDKALTCAAPASTAATAAAAPVREAAPAYKPCEGARSVRHVMPDHEQAVIDAALTILGGYLRQPADAFHAPDAVRQYLRLHLGAEARELFAVMFLDSQNRLKAFEVMFVGTLTQTSVYPREVVKAALAHDAAAVVLAHNHPSGSVQPSRADEVLTHSLKGALALVDVRVLDHVIVSAVASLSMAEQGLI